MAQRKAQAKAGKLKAKKLKTKRTLRKASPLKRGRPRVQGAVREPNGRISRAKVPSEPIDKLALEVRAWKLGVSVEAARDPRLATYIGRLAILGAEHGGLSKAQYEAALVFLEVLNDWRKAISSPAAVWEAQILTGEEIGLSVEEAIGRAKKRYQGAMRAVGDAQNQHVQDNLYAALQYLVIEDKVMGHMVGALRLVLNALARHFDAG